MRGRIVRFGIFYGPALAGIVIGVMGEARMMSSGDAGVIDVFILCWYAELLREAVLAPHRRDR